MPSAGELALGILRTLSFEDGVLREKTTAGRILCVNPSEVINERLQDERQ